MIWPECPGKLATFARSFKSQIFTILNVYVSVRIFYGGGGGGRRERFAYDNMMYMGPAKVTPDAYLSEVPVPKIRPSG